MKKLRQAKRLTIEVTHERGRDLGKFTNMTLFISDGRFVAAHWDGATVRNSELGYEFLDENGCIVAVVTTHA